jgi:hypothetical protein
MRIVHAQVKPMTANQGSGLLPRRCNKVAKILGTVSMREIPNKSALPFVEARMSFHNP